MVKLAIQDQGGFREISGCYCGAAEISPDVRFLWVSAVGLGVYCQDVLPLLNATLRSDHYCYDNK